MLPPVAMGVPSAYEHFMNGIKKMCNGHPWCTTKTTTIQNDFGFTFRHSFVWVISNAHITIVSINFVMGSEGFAIAMSGLDQLLFHSVLEVNFLPISHTYTWLIIPIIDTKKKHVFKKDWITCLKYDNYFIVIGSHHNCGTYMTIQWTQ